MGSYKRSASNATARGAPIDQANHCIRRQYTPGGGRHDETFLELDITTVDDKTDRCIRRQYTAARPAATRGSVHEAICKQHSLLRWRSRWATASGAARLRRNPQLICERPYCEDTLRHSLTLLSTRYGQRHVTLRHLSSFVPPLLPLRNHISFNFASSLFSSHQ